MARKRTSIAVHITGDTKDLQRAFAETETKAEQMGRRLGQVGTRLTLGVTLPLAGMGFKAIEAASNVEQALGGLEAVFGDAAQDVVDYSETTVEKVGLSQRAWSELVTPLGAMLSNAGLSMDETKEKTIDLSERAADMAAVFGTDVGEALGAMTAAIRGERDPIERFGVTIREADVKARALALGLTDSEGNITQYGKTMATLSLIMEQTEKTAGAFNRESDTTAVKTQQLRGRIEDLAAEFGTNLLPIAEDALEWANDMAEAFGSLDEDGQKAVLSVAGVAAAIGPIALAGSGVAKAVEGVKALASSALVSKLGIAAGAFTGMSGGLLTLLGAAGGLADIFSGRFVERVEGTGWATEGLARALDSAGFFGQVFASGLEVGLGPEVESYAEKVERARDLTIDLPDHLAGAGQSAGDLGDDMGDLGDDAEGMGEDVEEASTAVADAMKDMAEKSERAIGDYRTSIFEMPSIFDDASGETIRSADDFVADITGRLSFMEGINTLVAQGLLGLADQFAEQGYSAEALDNLQSTLTDPMRFELEDAIVDGTNAAQAAAEEGLNMKRIREATRDRWVGLGEYWGQKVKDGFNSVDWNFNVTAPRISSPGSGSGGGVRVLHDGGVVPGAPGTETLALLAAGETVLPTHKPGFRAGGGAQVVQVVLDGRVVAEAVNRQNAWEQRRGAML